MSWIISHAISAVKSETPHTSTLTVPDLPLSGCVQAMYGPVDRDLGLSQTVRVRAPAARSRELAIAPGRRV